MLPAGLMILMLLGASASDNALIVKYDHADRRAFLNSELTTHLLLFLSDRDDENEQLLEQLRGAARVNGERVLHVYVPSTQEIPQRFFGLEPEEMPAYFIYKNAEDQKFRDEEAAVITQQTMISFTEKVLQGRHPMYLRSEKAPASNAGPVQKLVGKTFTESIADPEHDWFVLFHAPDCPYTAEVLPSFKQLANNFESLPSLRFATLDYTANEVQWTNFRLDHSPTLYLFHRPDKANPVSFEAPELKERSRDAAGLEEFLREQGLEPQRSGADAHARTSGELRRLVVADDDCVSVGSKACDADPLCEAFGVYGSEVQLHGCNTTIPNNDWTIYAKQPNGSFAKLPGHVNVDESKCAHHPKSAGPSCTGPTPPPTPPTPPTPPPPSPPPYLYTVEGSIDVGTLENSIFYWKGTMYLLENLGCNYIDHAGIWYPEFKGHSYARVRELATGKVVSNITSTISHAFISAFPDYKRGRLWLFGIDFDRCHGTHKGSKVVSWWTSDLLSWETATAIDDYSTYNTEVSAVPTPPPGMQPHGYVMILEPFGYLINNDPNGNLTQSGSGWVKPANGTAAPRAPSGGPSIRFSDGWYYTITGGHTVNLFRSTDLKHWQASPHNPLIKPTPADAQIAPLAGFNESYERKGFGPMNECPGCWDRNSNDGDVCCLTPELNESWLVWGASTQGGKPTPPVKHGSTNAVGRGPVPLAKLLAGYFTARDASHSGAP